jgi:pimeloyl-ACP methyl ester carboxylesterase
MRERESEQDVLQSAPSPRAVPVEDVEALLAHLPAWRLSWANDGGWMTRGEALLSATSGANAAVVFVHGWGGDAGGTWEDFQGNFRVLSEARTTDALFWGYPSRTPTVAFCAAKFREFLADLLDAPAPSILNPSLPPGAPPRDDGFRYSQITLCAHSMGAVIARRAMIDLEREGKLGDPRPIIRLLLFAPAHKGSNLPLMLASGFGLERLLPATLVGNFLRLYFRSLNDLAVGSDTLRRLEEDCRALRVSLENKGEDVGHLEALVLHAENDHVVEQEPFDDDPPFTAVMKQNHRSICKPDDSYREPLEVLRKLL